MSFKTESSVSFGLVASASLAALSSADFLASWRRLMKRTIRKMERAIMMKSTMFCRNEP